MNTFAIMSTTNPARLPENVAAANHPLARDEVSLLEKDDE
jgi:aryl-alcohol dehydrogenase-like predicted oxidoreductase